MLTLVQALQEEIRRAEAEIQRLQSGIQVKKAEMQLHNTLTILKKNGMWKAVPTLSLVNKPTKDD